MKPPVVMVHGAFCGGWAFEDFRRPFEADGRTCEAPNLRAHAPGDDTDAVANLSMSDYAADVAAVVDRQAAPPVLIGHSMGGLVAQMAATRCKIAALVLLAPSAPWGILGDTLEEAGSASVLYGLGAFWTQAVQPDRHVAGFYSLDQMQAAERSATLSRMTAESGRALYEVLNWWLDPMMTTRVDPDRIGAPVFVAAGGEDRIHPPSTVNRTARRLGAGVHIFKPMSHWLIGEPGWEEVAGTVLAWLGEKGL